MDANDIKKTEIVKFREYLVLGDFYYKQNDVDSALKSYFSALKIDKSYYNVLLKNIHDIFFSKNFI